MSFENSQIAEFLKWMDQPWKTFTRICNLNQNNEIDTCRDFDFYFSFKRVEQVGTMPSNLQTV